MESLYKLNFNINEEYLLIIDNIFKILFSYIFLILIEGNTNVNALTLLTYNLVGVLFYQLVFKKLIIIQ